MLPRPLFPAISPGVLIKGGLTLPEACSPDRVPPGDNVLLARDGECIPIHEAGCLDGDVEPPEPGSDNAVRRFGLSRAGKILPMWRRRTLAGMGWSLRQTLHGEEETRKKMKVDRHEETYKC